MKTYGDYLNEKKTKKTSAESVVNTEYWVTDATNRIFEAINHVLIMGGLTTAKVTKEDLAAYENFTLDDDMSDLEKSKKTLDVAKTMTEVIISIPPEDWKINGYRIKPYSVPSKFKNAIRDLQNAITITANASKRSQEYEERIKGTSSPGAKSLNRYRNKAKSKVNRFFSIVNGSSQIRTYKTRSDSTYNSLVSLRGRIDYLSPLIDSMVGLDGIENQTLLGEMEETLGSIRDRVNSNIKNLQTQSGSSDYNRNKKSYAEQYEKFNDLKDNFFDTFGDIMESSSRAESANSLIDNANAKIGEAEEMIELQGERTKMFKGIAKGNTSVKDVEMAATYATNKTQAEQAGEDKDSNADDGRKETSFNGKTVVIDKQLSDILDNGIDIGEVEADIQKLLNLIKGFID